jgi:hypothetical protein
MGGSQPVDPIEYRRLFATFAGTDRYRQFLRALNGQGRWRGRFLYWQEELLAEFAASTGTEVVTFEQVESLLRVCEEHHVELERDPEALSSRCRGWANEFTLAQAEHFPNTDCGPLEMGRRHDNYRYGLWYCPVCRASEAEWRRQRA